MNPEWVGIVVAGVLGLAAFVLSIVQERRHRKDEAARKKTAERRERRRKDQLREGRVAIVQDALTQQRRLFKFENLLKEWQKKPADVDYKKLRAAAPTAAKWDALESVFLRLGPDPDETVHLQDFYGAVRRVRSLLHDTLKSAAEHERLRAPLDPNTDLLVDELFEEIERGHKAHGRLSRDVPDEIQDFETTW